MKNYLGSVFAIVFLSFPCLGMENDQDLSLEPYPSYGSQFYEFTRERFSGFYYTTSVVGYGSNNHCISEFLQGQFKEGWTISEPICLREELPSQFGSEYKICADLFGEDCKQFNFSPDQPIDDLNIVRLSSTYQYLYKEGSDLVKIILLDKCTALDFFTTKEFTNFTLDQLEEKRLSYLNALIEHLEAGHTDLNQEYKQISAEYEELKKYLATWKKTTFYHSWFDYSKGNSFLRASDCLLEICKTFNNKPIEIHALLESKESISSNLAARWVSFASGNISPFIGHLSYAQIDINIAEQNMAVKVIDPTFDPEHPYTKPFFGSSHPLPDQSLRLFQKVADSTHLTLNHHYYFRGDQVVNFHDCGRFSTIYLLFQTEGRNALNLSNYDVYQGFKRLEAGGYHLMHQTQSEKNPLPKFQTKFTRFLTGPLVRTPCDFILGTFFTDVSETSNATSYHDVEEKTQNNTHNHK